MKRVLVIGMSGGGKSTLAVKLGTLLDLPVYHLDSFFWKPGWKMTDDTEWLTIVRRLIAGDRWIIDGNYDGTLQVRLPRADTVIHLDFPRYVCLWRVAKRVILGWGETRADMAPGCPERWDWSFLRWVWEFPRRHRPVILRKLAAYEGPAEIVTLHTAREVTRYLDGLRHGVPSGQDRD